MNGTGIREQGRTLFAGQICGLVALKVVFHFFVSFSKLCEIPFAPFVFITIELIANAGDLIHFMGFFIKRMRPAINVDVGQINIHQTETVIRQVEMIELGMLTVLFIIGKRPPAGIIEDDGHRP